jgi:hypothetical protein
VKKIIGRETSSTHPIPLHKPPCSKSPFNKNRVALNTYLYQMLKHSLLEFNSMVSYSFTIRNKTKW